MLIVIQSCRSLLRQILACVTTAIDMLVVAVMPLLDAANISPLPYCSSEHSPRGKASRPSHKADWLYLTYDYILKQVQSRKPLMPSMALLAKQIAISEIILTAVVTITSSSNLSHKRELKKAAAAGISIARRTRGLLVC